MGSECDGATTGWGWRWLHWLWHLYPLCLLGDALISIHSMFCVSVMGTLEGKGRPAQITESKWAILWKEKSQEEKWWGLYAWIPLNQPLSWLSWHWGAKCHANSSGSPEKEQVPSPSAAGFCLLRIACCLRQMPWLINALPLAQQLSNKQDISVGLLSVFCVTERKREREGGASKYSKPIRWDPVYMSCCFIWCFLKCRFSPFLYFCPPTDFRGINGRERE